MFDKTILENNGILEFVRECYKNQEMCNKPLDNYLHALKLVPNCYITQKMCDKAVNTYHSRTQSVPQCYKAQEMCDKAVNRFFLYLILFLVNIKLNKYGT